MGECQARINRVDDDGIDFYFLDFVFFHFSSYTSPYTQHTKMSAVAGPSTKPVIPFYCEVCTLPTEYCEFGPSFTKCKTWLESEDKGEFDRLWGEGPLMGYMR
jgi:hypothetical protein